MRRRPALAALRTGVFATVALATVAALTSCGRSGRDDTAYGGTVSVWRDVAYLDASESQRLDVYVPRDQKAPPPLVVFAHGGGWMDLTKDDVTVSVSSYLSAGWAVANVEYRSGREATAPAAAADVRCAIKWAARHAAEFGADATRLVLAGESAGAHLMLLAAFADSTARLDAACAGPMPPVAGIVNWMGITDVNDLLAGPNTRGWATGWIGQSSGAEERARLLSPLRWIRPGLPPVMTVHGDQDGAVPLAHAQRLHAALDSAGVANELVVLPGADHGPLTPAAASLARSAIMRFLAGRGAPASPQ